VSLGCNQKAISVVRDTFDQPQIKTSALFDEEYDALQKALNRNEIPNFIVTYLLKDETLPLHKTQDPRAFTGGNRHHMLMTKQYLAQFVGETELWRADGDIQIGINVHSLEWKHIYSQLQAYSTDLEGNLPDDHGSKDHPDGIIAGDFSKWDIRYPFIIGFMLWCMIKDYWPEDFQKKLLLVILSGLNPIIYIGNAFYQFDIMSSGWWGTAYFNSVANSVMHRVMWKLLVPPEYRYRFKDFVRLFIYGDDSLGSVRPEVREYYNMQTLSKAFKEHLGWEYTDSNKSSTVIPFINIRDAVFLSRRFSVEGPNVFCPLDKESIKMSLMWTSDVNTFRSACASALLESAMHGESFYETIRKTINDRIHVLPVPHNQPFVEPYQWWLDQWNEGHMHQ
jgi:hypothetical protein